MVRTANSTAPTVADLRRLRTREGRDRSGLFYVEGVRVVAEAVRSDYEIEACVVAPELLQSEYGFAAVRELDRRGVPVLELGAAAFGSISFKENLQGIGAVVRARTEPLSAAMRGSATLGWVALFDVGNPGNLGAILRSSDAVGCSGIILLGDTIDPFHPAAVRASTGAVFSQRIVRAGLDELAQWADRWRVPVVGTAGDAPREYREVAYPTPMVLLSGSERLGLPHRQQALCDFLVRIPMVGTSDSLNVAVATSVVLYEVFHQSRAGR